MPSQAGPLSQGLQPHVTTARATVRGDCGTPKDLIVRRRAGRESAGWGPSDFRL